MEVGKSDDAYAGMPGVARERRFRTRDDEKECERESADAMRHANARC